MIRAFAEEENYLTKFSNGTGAGYADVLGAQGGTGTGFRPSELLEAALATCMNITLRMYAANHKMPLEDVSTEVTLESGADETVFRFEVRLIGEGLTDEQRSRLIEIANACSVKKKLSKPIRLIACRAKTGSPSVQNLLTY